MEQWENFKRGKWCDEVNVSDFIKTNYLEYKGKEDFLTSLIYSCMTSYTVEEVNFYIMDL